MNGQGWLSLVLVAGLTVACGCRATSPFVGPQPHETTAGPVAPAVGLAADRPPVASPVAASSSEPAFAEAGQPFRAAAWPAAEAGPPITVARPVHSHSPSQPMAPGAMPVPAIHQEPLERTSADVMPAASAGPVVQFAAQAVQPRPLVEPPDSDDAGSANDAGNANEAEELPPQPEAGESVTSEDYLALPRIEANEDWKVTLPIVIDSVQRTYPLLRLAALQGEITEGDLIAAQGAFDLKLKAESLNQPQGFYKNYRHKASLTQPTFNGGYAMGSYRLGDGFFPEWYGERVTNEGGEFAMGFGGPLLQNRQIDERRSELFQAEVARQAVDPNVRAQMLDFVRAGSQAYWVWVASGQAVEAWRELLRLAQERITQINKRVEAGDLERIVRINNEQLIAARETKVIEAERKLQLAAIKLSLFLRTPVGQPIVPAPEQLPDAFPDHRSPDDEQLQADIDLALMSRPELVELDLMSEQFRIELAQAENSMLPQVDWVVYASKDVGARASSKGDKTPFELEAGLVGEVPLQRRKARGKIRSLEGKLAQLTAKREFTANKIVAEVQDAVSALRAAAGRIERARTNLSLATETRVLARAQFDAGDIDLVELNIYEQAVTDAQFLLIAAQADFFIAEADFRAALAIDPNRVSELRLGGE